MSPKYAAKAVFAAALATLLSAPGCKNKPAEVGTAATSGATTTQAAPVPSPTPTEKLGASALRANTATLPVPSQNDVLLVTFTLTAEGVYDRNLITVPQKRPLKLVFKNNGTAKHNVVLARPKFKDQILAEAQRVGEAGGYLPKSPEVLIGTPLIDAGKEISALTQTPAAPDEFRFFCTVPGHAATEMATVKVEP